MLLKRIWCGYAFAFSHTVRNLINTGETMNTKLLIILTSLALGFGCQQNQSGSEGTPTAAKTVAPQEKRDVLSNGVVIEIYKVTTLRNDRSNYNTFKQNINVYETKITIPEHVFTSDLEISRTLNAASLNPSYEIISKSDAELIDDNKYVVIDRISFRDSDLTPKTVTYKVYTNEMKNGESTATLIPDLIVEKGAEAVTLQSLGISSGRYEFGVIVFENNSILRTEGGSVLFKAQRVFAENAIVESFDQEFSLTPAPLGQSGKNGGRFNLQAELAWGDLTINMRGTVGGKGFPAKQQTAVGAAGSKGANGRREKYACESIGPKHISGKADVLFTTKDPDVIVCEWRCIKPTNGTDGNAGPAGFEGGVGMSGGMSGSAEILVREKLEKFNVEITRTAGAGGLGGDGSQGGAGGAGGPPGDVANYCDQGASSGRAGAQGPTGPQGPKGQDGGLEQSSITINGEKVL